MADNLDNKLDKLEHGQDKLDSKERVDSAELESAKISIENVDSLDESGEGFSDGDVNEKKEKAKGVYNGSGTQTISSKSSVKEPDSETEMINQIIVSINKRKDLIESKIPKLKSRVETNPHILNEAVKELRNLNGILEKLKNASKMAKDAVKALWEKYVAKKN